MNKIKGLSSDLNKALKRRILISLQLHTSLDSSPFKVVRLQTLFVHLTCFDRFSGAISGSSSQNSQNIFKKVNNQKKITGSLKQSPKKKWGLSTTCMGLQGQLRAWTQPQPVLVCFFCIPKKQSKLCSYFQESSATQL